jgi:hypothetical protein
MVVGDSIGPHVQLARLSALLRVSPDHAFALALGDRDEGLDRVDAHVGVHRDRIARTGRTFAEIALGIAFRCRADIAALGVEDHQHVGPARRLADLLQRREAS